MRRRPVVLLTLLAGLLAAQPAAAQLVGGGLPSVGGLPNGLPLRGLETTVEDVRTRAVRSPADASRVLGAVSDRVEPYRRQARNLLRRSPDAVELDDLGQPVVRGEVAGLGVTAAALARARAAGFQLQTQEAIESLGLATVVLAPPRGMSAREALRRLRALDPAGRYDLNHIYFESGGGGGAATPEPAAGGRSGRGLRIGLVDGSAATREPALAGLQITQQAFAPGGAKVTAHATAVASLLAGSTAGFQGAAPGAALYIADVYGPTAAGGSAMALARGLGWLARVRTPVINVSLVGPRNAVLEAAVEALVARGYILVAAVGNDGPGAAPLYPAAYPGVVAVTGVDARRRVLPEAGRGAHVAFAAPGADMVAASASGGFTGVRGTSFAAPLAAARLAELSPAPDPVGAARAIEALGREAADLGAPGRDPVYGRGLVAADLAVRPSALAAQGPGSRPR